MDDKEIIQKVLDGNRDMYRLLVERHMTLVFKTAVGFLHNKDDADDLTQEVFIQAYEALAKFRGSSAFSTWLYRITVNAALNKLRKSQKSKVTYPIDAVSGNESYKNPVLLVPDDDNPEKMVIQNQQQKRVWDALNSIPEKQRTAIVLSKYDNLSQKEIASVMGLTEGAVEALIQRAKSNLRKKLHACVGKR